MSIRVFFWPNWPNLLKLVRNINWEFLDKSPTGSQEFFSLIAGINLLLTLC